MKNKLLIIGASGHGKVVADIAMKMNRWESISFLDDDQNIKSSLGLKVIGKTEDLLKYIDEYDMFVGIGDNAVREKVYKQLVSVEATVPTLIHPTVIIAEDVVIGEGTVIMAGVIINPSTKIGNGCIINTGVTVDHDNVVGNYVHLSPGTHLAGTVKVGCNSWLGIGSIVSNNINITSGCITGAGAVVTTNIIESGTYVGVPVRRVKL